MRMLVAVAAAALLGCASGQAARPVEPAPIKPDTAGPPPGPGALSVPNADPFPSTYTPVASHPTAIQNATIFTAAGPRLERATILLQNGKVAAIGTDIQIPADAVLIDGTGKYVTPGLIDTHSHLGVYPAPGTEANSDGNEATSPATPQVWAEHSVWPQDPQFPRNLAGGVTTLQALPGSANLFGGRSVVLKVVPSRTVQGMKFPGAKYGLKMACGENPKRVYGSRSVAPSTRMGNVAGYRAEWIRAEQYRRSWDKWQASHKGDPPARDLGLETLAEALRGNILVQMHCYRADEMAVMLDVAREFGYRIRSFHHAVEAYKIADLLASDSVSASIWADWGGFKMEALDGVRANLALVDQAGARAVVHSDDPSGSQRLTQEAAKGLAAGRAIGLPLGEEDAIRWVTINPAWTLGLDDRIGSLEVGKNADVVLWSGDPFSVYTRSEKVWVDGALLYDRGDPASLWRTDFEQGYVPQPGESG